MSYLPLAHIYERVMTIGFVAQGIAIGFFRFNPAKWTAKPEFCMTGGISRAGQLSMAGPGCKPASAMPCKCLLDDA